MKGGLLIIAAYILVLVFTPFLWITGVIIFFLLCGFQHDIIESKDRWLVRKFTSLERQLNRIVLKLKEDNWCKT